MAPAVEKCDAYCGRLGAPSKSQAQRKIQIATKIRPSTLLDVTLLCYALRSACKITPDSSLVALFLHQVFSLSTFELP